MQYYLSCITLLTLLRQRKFYAAVIHERNLFRIRAKHQGIQPRLESAGRNRRLSCAYFKHSV